MYWLLFAFTKNTQFWSKYRYAYYLHKGHIVYLKSKSGKFYRLLDKGKQKKPKKQKNHKRVDEISLH